MLAKGQTSNMAERAVWLCFIFIAICAHSFAEETENLPETDQLKGNWFTAQGFDIVNEFYISFYSQLKFQMQSKRTMPQKKLMTPSWKYLMLTQH